MNRFIKPLNLAVAAALIGPATSLAHESEENPETVLITASRTAQTADEALASVTVITREEIDQSQAQSVQELLSSTAVAMARAAASSCAAPIMATCST